MLINREDFREREIDRSRTVRACNLPFREVVCRNFNERSGFFRLNTGNGSRTVRDRSVFVRKRVVRPRPDGRFIENTFSRPTRAETLCHCGDVQFTASNYLL